jgi:CRISPR-associated endonuclease/helicase Cas3
MLQRKHFKEFFASLHDGHSPFAWQERLLDDLLERGAWPARITAPTGAGKTSAIDVHVFAVALTADLDGPRLPRRLAMVVGRRVLVDDQHEHAEKMRESLAAPSTDELAMVAEALWRLRRPGGSAEVAATGLADAGPLMVARLRGGVAQSRDWRDHPSACAVICATPDMWGSRLLFRGYGSSLRARPREAGLLALDAAVVVDEAHLSRQLLTTANQVAHLVRVAEQPLPLPALQVVETTATPARAGDESTDSDVADGWTAGVTAPDLVADPVLAQRLTRPKPLTLAPGREWPAATPARRKRVAARLAEQVVEVLAAPGGAGSPVHTVGCYVNTVAMAVEVADTLRDRTSRDGARLRVVTICGQTRSADLARLDAVHPGVLSITGNPAVDVVVTTQSLEVGVDLDLSAVVSELAPASALAQRAGRANRRGLRATAPVHVVVPEATLTDRDRSGPYQHDDLATALEWLRQRATDPAGLAPWALQGSPPPPAAPRRRLYQRPELAEIWHNARTGDALAAEPRPQLWLADELDEETTAWLTVRDRLPEDAAEAVSLLRLLPPRRHELFTVPPATLRTVFAHAVRGEQPPPVLRIRGDDIIVLDPEQAANLRAGDILVVDSRTEAFTPSTLPGGGFSPPVPVWLDPDPATAAAPAAANDVFHDTEPTRGTVALRLEPAAWPAETWVEPLLKQYADSADQSTGTGRRQLLRRLLSEVLARHDTAPHTRLLEQAVAMLGRVRDSDLELHRDHTAAPVRLVVVDRRHGWADERLRQTWLPTSQPVPLDAHQAAVGERAKFVAAAVGLPAPLVEVLRLAGEHHDDGKADLRFQARLGAGDVLLAKSGGGAAAESRAHDPQRQPPPPRWRHEQMSVLACWHPVHNTLPAAEADLVARLVGTSHGHGRSTFPHTCAELLPAEHTTEQRTLGEDLFDAGGWDQLIEATHRVWGVWGCAYLEALLRGTDCQVSEEGT